MKLNEYVKSHSMSIAEAARSFGSTTQSMYYWAKGLRIPRPAAMKKIQAWTDGKVQPKDFYDDD